MNVTAIKCEACKTCEGMGIVEEPGWWGPNGGRIPEVVECPVCDGTGIERPPTQDTDEDIRARQAVEGTKYENL